MEPIDPTVIRHIFLVPYKESFAAGTEHINSVLSIIEHNISVVSAGSRPVARKS